MARMTGSPMRSTSARSSGTGTSTFLTSSGSIWSTVARVNRNWLGEYFFDPNDTYYWSHQWNLRKTDVPEAWDYASAAGDPGGSTRYMAIVDSGVDRDHEDLGYIYGWNFVDNNGQRGDGCSP
jgi:hypothetical protein